MNKRKNKIALLIILILVITSLFFIFTKSSKDTLEDINKSFRVKDTSSIIKMFIVDKYNNSVILEKNDDKSWQLNGKYIAKQEMVSTLLETFYKIRASYPPSIASRNTIIKILSTTGVKVEVYANSFRINLFDKIKWFPYVKKIITFYVGEPTPDQLGTMMMIEGSDEPMITYIPSFRGFLSTRFSQFEKDWRDNNILKINYAEVKSVKIDYAEKPENSFFIVKNNLKEFDLFTLPENKKIEDIDTISCIEFFSNFKSLAYERVLDYNQKLIDSLKNAPYFINIEVLNNINAKWLIKLYKIKLPEGSVDLNGNPTIHDPERMYAVLNENYNEIVSMQYYPLDLILRDIKYFVKD